MTHDLTDWQKTVYDALLWLADELRQRDPNVILPYFVEQIVLAAETARENERIVPLSFPSKPASTCQEASFASFLEERFPVTWEGSRGDVAEIVRLHCRVDSLAEIKPGTRAEAYWNDLRREYEEWKRGI